MGCGHSSTAAMQSGKGWKGAKRVSKAETILARLQVGKFSSRYSLGQRLGCGAQGEVYACTSTSDSSCYAVKMMDKRNRSEEQLERMAKEVAIHKEIKDCHFIIGLKEHIEAKKVTYLVMELADGGELYDNISKADRYTEAHAAHYIRQICEAMAFMHSKSIVHRDLKPANMLCKTSQSPGKANKVKICDFGLAENLPMGEYIDDDFIVGTPSFLSTELVSGQPYGHATDVWAVGVMAFMFLCGRLPFDSDDDPCGIGIQKYDRLLDKIAHGAFEFDDRDDNVSTTGKDFVRKMLDTDQYKRPTFEEALKHPFVNDGGHSNLELSAVPSSLAAYNESRKKLICGNKKVCVVKYLADLSRKTQQVGRRLTMATAKAASEDRTRSQSAVNSNIVQVSVTVKEEEPALVPDTAVTSLCDEASEMSILEYKGPLG